MYQNVPKLLHLVKAFQRYKQKYALASLFGHPVHYKRSKAEGPGHRSRHSVKLSISNINFVSQE